MRLHGKSFEHSLLESNREEIMSNETDHAQDNLQAF